MAHNLEYRNDRGTSSFFSRKELAWHQLGQVVQDTVNPNEALKLANLDYEVALKPIYASFIPEGCVVRGNEPYFEVYDKQNNFIQSIQKKGVILPNNKAVCRMDNYVSLGVVGNKYTPVQNIESINFIYDILKHNPDIKEKDDIIIETAGVLGQGERIFVTAKLPKGFKVGEETESTELYIVFTNSHDGSSALTAMVTPIRVVCNNTLTAALGSNKSKVAFRHTKNISTAMKEGLSLLRLSYDNFETNKQLYNALIHIKVESSLVDELICRAMLNDNQLMQVDKFGMTNLSTDVVSTRLRNTMSEMRDYVDMGVGQNTNRGTLYWAYMGLNSYLNNGVNYKDAESKFDNLLGGTTSKTDAKVLELCKSYL